MPGEEGTGPVEASIPTWRQDLENRPRGPGTRTLSSVPSHSPPVTGSRAARAEIRVTHRNVKRIRLSNLH